uniref:VQ domain-containing protein n=1 Tax=Kalanchoe fedtschenkoi TaxID=63787 RepID=A0A7N0U7Q2_KALFE
MSSGAVKIVIIDTEYIETDERSFKEVVQRLTGKVSGSGSQGTGSDRKERRRDKTSSVALGGKGADSLLSRDWSFKEFEYLISEFPISYLLAENTT